jgi:deoxyribonuclease IV
MGELRYGPSYFPSRERPEDGIRTLREAGYDACEVDFERKFWLDRAGAARLGELAREAGILLSIHAPLFAFMGHAEIGKKQRMAVGTLDHTAGLAKELGAELVVVHPGYLLGRSREEAIASVIEQFAELGERLEKKDRLVPFGVEVMGRVNELGSLTDVLEICAALPWLRPVIDFAHMHATSDGAYTSVEPFEEALRAADAEIEPGAPFHIHFSDIDFANRNEKSHLPYGQGTLRAEPFAEALARCDRPATVISESPDEASNQAIKAVLGGKIAPRQPR